MWNIYFKVGYYFKHDTTATNTRHTPSSTFDVCSPFKQTLNALLSNEELIIENKKLLKQIQLF